MTRLEQIQQSRLSEVKLSTQENTVSGISRKYIENNGALVKDVSIFKKDFCEEIRQYTGKGIGEHTAKKLITAVQRCRTRTNILMLLTSYMLAGDGLKVV